MSNQFSFQRLFSVARKEVLHIRRDPTTFFIAFIFPIIELFLIGFAIETNVRDLRTVVLNQAQTEESKRLIRAFEASGTFKRVPVPVYSEQDVRTALKAGKARVGIIIPSNYSEQIQSGMKPAQVLVLIDGSESSIATAASGSVDGVINKQVVEIMQKDGIAMPKIEVVPRIEFNPSTRSANFFVPGLLVVLCQFMAVVLAANAVVREKEQGTLEQLFMTPVRGGELILGKLLPYFVFVFLEFGTVLLLMVTIFRVPIHGPLLTLIGLMIPFVFGFLGLGLLISTRVSTREAASQAAMGTLLPSIFLSGYVFPIDSMPVFFWYISQIIPTTWMIDGSRGVILRGASWGELWPHALVLWGMGLATFVVSAVLFRKRL